MFSPHSCNNHDGPVNLKILGWKAEDVKNTKKGCFPCPKEYSFLIQLSTWTSLHTEYIYKEFHVTRYYYSYEIGRESLVKKRVKVKARQVNSCDVVNSE